MKQLYGRITGWGKYVPERVMTNAEIEQMVDTSDEWIVERTGIRERHVAGEHEPTSFMAVRAAENAMKVAGIKAKDLDLIIVANSSPDYFLPPVSSQIQDKLGASCGAFTLVAGLRLGPDFTSAFGAQPTWRDILVAASRSKMTLS